MPEQATSMQTRAVAALLVRDILDERHNLSQRLPHYQQRLPSPDDQRFLQSLSYELFRHYYRLDAIAGALLNQPLKKKDRDLYALILLGLLQLRVLRTPSHAAVSATVSACDELGKSWARKLVNAILRRYQRESEHLQSKLASSPQVNLDCPQWLLDKLQKAYPDAWQTVAAAGNDHPPMSLRVNRRRTTREHYLARLYEAGIAAEPGPVGDVAITLHKPVDVALLPGFYDGLVSVQDPAAQLACGLLAPGGERILDACAAPGGKLAHILENVDDTATVIGIEVSPARLETLRATLQRLGLNATLIQADAGATSDWWDGMLFDRILLDAPCTATGVIRRHPDIKILRTIEDVETAKSRQAQLLRSLWPLLKSGGKLLYATCSLLPEENDQQVETLLSEQGDANTVVIDAPWGHTMRHGRQILPGEHGMDGFYYACIEKRRS